jgi:predicted NUDIX family phosphoesterase
MREQAEACAKREVEVEEEEEEQMKSNLNYLELIPDDLKERESPLIGQSRASERRKHDGRAKDTWKLENEHVS